MSGVIINRVGETSLSSNGEVMIITEYYKCENITVQFEDGTIIKNKQYQDFKKGNIFNYNFPIYFGKGFLGGKVPASKTKVVSTWYNILQRCYSLNQYKSGNRTYKGCSIHKDWHNFQNFAKWFEENYKPEVMQKWHLDKDILVPGNKIYGPDTCCFVPHEINVQFRRNFEKSTLVGKLTRKQRFEKLSFLAEKYKNNLDSKVFEILKNKSHESIK